VICGNPDVHAQTDSELTVFNDWLFDRCADGKDSGLWWIDDGVE
jgi:hypothetical protein